MSADPSQPALLALPRELRDLIYEYTLSIPIAICRPLHLPKNTTLFSTRNFGLLLTNRQIHHEAIELYYTLSIFTTEYNHFLFEYLGALPQKYLSRIREVRMETDWASLARYKSECLRGYLRNLGMKGKELGNGVLVTRWLVEGQEIWASEQPEGWIPLRR